MTAIHLYEIREGRWFGLFTLISPDCALRSGFLAGPVAAAIGCAPFGDPPQTLISYSVPNCLGGTRLGPWYDSTALPAMRACTNLRPRRRPIGCRCSYGCILRW